MLKGVLEYAQTMPLDQHWKLNQYNTHRMRHIGCNFMMVKDVNMTMPEALQLSEALTLSTPIQTAIASKKCKC